MPHPTKRKRHTAPLNFTSRFKRSPRKECKNFSDDEEAKQAWLAEHQPTKLEPGYSQYGYGPLPLKA